MPVTLKYQAAGISDPGLQRENNEDRFHCDPDRGIFLVVDGMGGQAAGEMAAEIAVSMLRARLERQTGTPAERIREGIAIANNEIHRLSKSNPAWVGMACVLTAAIVEDGRATIGHVGDSRLYLLGAGTIRKVTSDHSPVGEREDRQEISEDEAMRHPRRNEVYRDVGSSEHSPDDAAFIDIVDVEFPADHAMLLCSDGLSDLVTSAEILRAAERNAGNPWSAAKSLIEAANAAGGKDNVTAIIVEGGEFAAAIRSSARHRKAPAPAAVERPLGLASRWAFLIYGAVLGALSLFVLPPLWQSSLPPSGDPPAATRRTWQVGPGETADAGTITAALRQARSGDTVVVAPGEYTESVQLRDEIDLVSRQVHGAVIHADAQGVAVLGEGIKSGRLSGFRIEGNAANPLTVGLDLKDSSIEVYDLSISGARVAGIDIRGSSAPVLRANEIVDNPGTGVIIRDTAAPRLTHNRISGNGKADRIRKPGVDIRDDSRPVLSGNFIIGNAAEQVWITPKIDGAAIAAQNHFGPLRTGTGRRAVRVMQR